MTWMRKVEMYVINHGDELSKEDMKYLLEESLDSVAVNCSVLIKEIKEKDIGVWDDDVKFNQRDTPIEEFRKEFE